MTIRGAFERHYPLIGGALLAAALCWSEIAVRQPDQLMNAGINIGGILAGFSMTAKSILIALPETPFLKKMKDAGAVSGLITYLLSAAKWSLALVVVSAFFLAAPEDMASGSPNARYFMAMWCGLMTVVCLAVQRVTTLFGGVLKNP